MAIALLIARPLLDAKDVVRGQLGCEAIEDPFSGVDDSVQGAATGGSAATTRSVTTITR